LSDKKEYDIDKRIIIFGLFIALSLVFFVSPLVSPRPDGLERVAMDKGFIGLADKRSLISSPVADYVWPGIKDERLATSVAGLAGTLILFGLGLGLAYLLKKKDAS
jgi:cobalt/nickel transport protein